MTENEIRAAVLAALKHIAPEADLATLRGGDDLRDALDIDSMDFDKFVLGLYETLKVDVPEKDYPKLFTLDGCIREIGARLAAGAR